MDTTNIVAKTAILLAEQLQASAIVVSGNIQLDGVFTDIPIYYAAKKPRSIISNGSSQLSIIFLARQTLMSNSCYYWYQVQ